MSTELATELDDHLAADELREPAVMPVAGDIKSIAEKLRAQRREVVRSRGTLFLDVPGYDGALVGEYAVVDFPLLERIGNSVAKASKKDDNATLKGHAAVIAAACAQLWARAPKGVGQFIDDAQEWLVPLSDVVEYDQPVRFDSVLGEFYGFNADGGVQAVLNCIAPMNVEGARDRAFSVTLHHNEIMEWMGEANTEADMDLLGESKAAGR